MSALQTPFLNPSLLPSWSSIAYTSVHLCPLHHVSHHPCLPGSERKGIMTHLMPSPFRRCFWMRGNFFNTGRTSAISATFFISLTCAQPHLLSPLRCGPGSPEPPPPSLGCTSPGPCLQRSPAGPRQALASCLPGWMRRGGQSQGRHWPGPAPPSSPALGNALPPQSRGCRKGGHVGHSLGRPNVPHCPQGALSPDHTHLLKISVQRCIISGRLRSRQWDEKRTPWTRGRTGHRVGGHSRMADFGHRGWRGQLAHLLVSVQV